MSITTLPEMIHLRNIYVHDTGADSDKYTMQTCPSGYTPLELHTYLQEYIERVRPGPGPSLYCSMFDRSVD